MGHYRERTEIDSVITSHLLSIKKGDFLAGDVFNNGIDGARSKIIVKVLKIVEEKNTVIGNSISIDRRVSLELEVIRASIDNIVYQIGDRFYTGVTGGECISYYRWYVLGVDRDKIPNIMSPFERTVCRFLKVMRLAEIRIPETESDFYIVFKSFLDLVDLIYNKLHDGYSLVSSKDNERTLIRKILRYNKRVKLYLCRLNTEIFTNNGDFYDMFVEFVLGQSNYREDEFKLKMLLTYTLTQEARNMVNTHELNKEIKRLWVEIGKWHF